MNDKTHLSLPNLLRTMMLMLIIFVVLLTGCQRETPPFEPAEVTIESLCQYEDGPALGMTEDALLAWIEDNTEYQPIPLWGVDMEAGGFYIWGPHTSLDSPVWSAELEGGYVTRLGYSNLVKGIRLGDVVDSFGEPSGFALDVSEDPLELRVGLNYPSLGLMLTHEQPTTRRQLKHAGEFAVLMEREMTVITIDCYQPVSEDDAAIPSFWLPWPGFDVPIPLGDVP